MGHGHHHHHGPEHAFHGPEEVARVVADGEIAIGFVAEVVGLLEAPVRKVVDIGSGPGVASLELARLLPEAEVVALDQSASMVEAVGERAAKAGLADRVSAREAELPGGMDGLTDVDLVWASMSLHHVSDEAAALREIAASLRDTGVVAILEFGDRREFTPPGHEDLSDRIEAAYQAYLENMQDQWHGDTPSGELGEMVRSAGLEIVSDHVSSITHEPPLDDAQQRFVTGSLQRARKQLEELLSDEDLATIDRLSEDPHREEAPVVVSRRILLARRSV